MRKVTNDVVKAFLAGESKTADNSSTDGRTLKLHGNTIATRDSRGGVTATLAGWPTPTTRERLNGLCTLLDIDRRFSQKGGKQFFGSREISAETHVVLT